MERKSLRKLQCTGFILLLYLGGDYLDTQSQGLCICYVLLLGFSIWDTPALLSRQRMSQATLPLHMPLWVP